MSDNVLKLLVIKQKTKLQTFYYSVWRVTIWGGFVQLLILCSNPASLVLYFYRYIVSYNEPQKLSFITPFPLLKRHTPIV